MFVVRRAGGLLDGGDKERRHDLQKGWHEDSGVGAAQSHYLFQLRCFRIRHGAIGHDIWL